MATVSEPVEQKRTGALGNLVLLALVLVLAFQLAYWTWVFVSPPRSAVTVTEQADVDLAAVARMFGAAPPAGAGPVSSSGLRLKGVIAPTPGVAASAIFSAGTGKDIAVYLDREVQPGVKLAEVHPDHVIVARAGVQERIDLEAPRSTAAASRAPGAGRQAGFRLNVARAGNNFALSRKELDDALRDPNQLNYLGALGTPPGGGVRMERAPPGSLAGKLGLQPGDIIRRVNGQAVSSQGDLARVYTQFGTLSSIQAEVQRGGSTLLLSYSIQP